MISLVLLNNKKNKIKLNNKINLKKYSNLNPLQTPNSPKKYWNFYNNYYHKDKSKKASINVSEH